MFLGMLPNVLQLLTVLELGKDSTLGEYKYGAFSRSRSELVFGPGGIK